MNNEPRHLVPRPAAIVPPEAGAATAQTAAVLVLSPVDPGWLRTAVPPSLVPIVEELLLGVVDTVGSRHLNISPRTYSRRVTELLDHFGVATRFQAGLKIGAMIQADAGSRAGADSHPQPWARAL